MKEESDYMKKEYEKIGKSKGVSTVQATTNDEDFEELIKKQLKQIHNG